MCQKIRFLAENFFFAILFILEIKNIQKRVLEYSLQQIRSGRFSFVLNCAGRIITACSGIYHRKVLVMVSLCIGSLAALLKTFVNELSCETYSFGLLNSLNREIYAFEFVNLLLSKEL